MAPNITEIHSTAQFDSILKGLQPGQLMVVDFHAVWCGPCKAIAPVLEQQSSKFTWVKFVKIDVDQQRELAQRFRVSAMPTFMFLKNGTEIAQLRGASPPRLIALITQHAGSASQFSSAGPSPKADSTSLLPLISPTGLYCLNESSEHPLASILGAKAGPKGSSYVESAADAELLITIPFNEPVRIKALSIFSVVSPSQAPKTVKLFINARNLDFAGAEGAALQELELKPEDVKGGKIELKAIKFQNVRSLHLLVKDNQGGEETTRIDSIDIVGSPMSASSSTAPLQKMGHD